MLLIITSPFRNPGPKYFVRYAQFIYLLRQLQKFATMAPPLHGCARASAFSPGLFLWCPCRLDEEGILFERGHPTAPVPTPFPCYACKISQKILNLSGWKFLNNTWPLALISDVAQYRLGKIAWIFGRKITYVEETFSEILQLLHFESTKNRRRVAKWREKM